MYRPSAETKKYGYCTVAAVSGRLSKREPNKTPSKVFCRSLGLEKTLGLRNLIEKGNIGLVWRPVSIIVCLYLFWRSTKCYARHKSMKNIEKVSSWVKTLHWQHSLLSDPFSNHFFSLKSWLFFSLFQSMNSKISIISFWNSHLINQHFFISNIIALLGIGSFFVKKVCIWLSS